MTMKHLLGGLMQATKARSYSELHRLVGIDSAACTRINNGKCKYLSMSTLVYVHEQTGLPFDTLFAWYRLPADAVLGRVA